MTSNSTAIALRAFDTIINFVTLIVSTIAIMPRSPTAKHWLFTWNNYPEDYQEIIVDKLDELGEAGKHYQYFVCGEEVGENGTPHLQGHVSLHDKIDFPAQRLWQAHWEIARKPAVNIDYCKKGTQPKEEWTRFGTNGPNYGRDAKIFELGDPPDKTQGKRTDIEDFRDYVEQFCATGQVYSAKRARKEFPNVAARHPTFVQQVIQDYRPKPQITMHALRPWQAHLIEILRRPANDRDIYFCLDRTGKSGKSWFCDYFEHIHGEDNVCVLRPGKKGDMAMIANEDAYYVFVDVPRGSSEVFHYAILEEIKDGRLSSPKYASYNKRWLKKPHVVCMVNDMPNLHELSQDRIVTIDTEHFVAP